MVAGAVERSAAGGCRPSGRVGGIADAKTITVRKIGGEKFDRIVKYTLPQVKPPAVGELSESDDTQLCGTCVNSGYDDGFELVCKLGFKPDDECSHFEGVTENSDVIDDVPF